MEQIIDAVRHIMHSRYTVCTYRFFVSLPGGVARLSDDIPLSGAAATLSIYDWILVFSDEIDTIWQSKWTLPKTLYYFVSAHRGKETTFTKGDSRFEWLRSLPSVLVHTVCPTILCREW